MTTTYISILRGINVSGHKMIKMDALRQLYSDLGFSNVRTYIQSGNVIFNDENTNVEEIEKNIKIKIKEVLGLDVQLIIKELSEYKEIVNNNPFVSREEIDPELLHVSFLTTKPLQVDVDKLIGQFTPEEFVLDGKVIYLYCPNGYGNTKLNNGFFEYKMKVIASTRNWKTTLELLRMAEES